MDVDDRLEELMILVEEAKAVPLSASCMVNRVQVLDLIDEIRRLLPRNLTEADNILSDRRAVILDGQAEADRLLFQAQAEQSRLVSQHEVYLVAVAEAERIRAEAYDEADEQRRQTDDYVDTKLANFEVVLNKTLAAVERGREKLRGRRAYDELDDEGEPFNG